MSMQGRILKLVSKYYAYTRDSATVEIYFDEKIVPIITMLRTRRAAAKKLPTTSASFGMPTGNELGDLWGGAVECGTTFPDGNGGSGGGCKTELPYVSIASEMVRGFEGLGRQVASSFEFAYRTHQQFVQSRLVGRRWPSTELKRP
jgi:hypothetical protein